MYEEKAAPTQATSYQNGGYVAINPATAAPTAPPPYGEIESNNPSVSLRGMNLNFMATQDGLLTLVEVALSVVVIICAGLTNFDSNGVWFIYFTSASALVLCIVNLVLHFANVPQSARSFPFMLTGFGVCFFWMIFYLAAGGIALSTANKCGHLSNFLLWIFSRCRDGYAACTAFSWLAAVMFLVHSVVYYRSYKTGVAVVDRPLLAPTRTS